MRKFIVSLVTLVSAPILVFAQVLPGGGGTPGGANTGSQFINFANNLLVTANILVTLLFVVALLVFAWGIVQFLFAAGDATKVKGAKGYILWGVVGMAVLASLFGLIAFLQQFFGISGTQGTLKAPDIQGINIRVQ